MPKNVIQKAMETHPPMEYYFWWCEHYNVDTLMYPYFVEDFDPAQHKKVTFVIFNFYLAKSDVNDVALVVLVYKSISSKSSFRKIVYI